MKSLNGYLKKILFLFLLSSFLYPFSNIYSANGFNIDTQINHEINDDIVNTTIYYSITSNDNPRVISYYTTTLPSEDVKPGVYYIEGNREIEPTYHKKNGVVDIVIDLDNTVVSKDRKATVRLTYSENIDTNNLALLSGITETTTSKVIINYPDSLGEISWSSTPVSKISTQGGRMEAVITNPQADITTVRFGDSFIYTFEVSKNLLNSTDKMYKSEVVLPPNSSNQNVYIKEYSPVPNNAYRDEDGNYILQYEIAPNSNLPVSISGYIQMLNSDYYKDISSFDFSEKDYWKFDNSNELRRLEKFFSQKGIDITEIENVKDLEDSEQILFYKYIYQYITEVLEPDPLTLGSLTGATRLGAIGSLQSEENVTAESYADAYIAILREFGIPSRFVIGYVTDASDYNPDGMYHYWVEYYDNSKQSWIIADPFLEDLSGVSLFNRDLIDHVAIIYRENNPTTPKLPYYTENDFMVRSSNDDIELKNILHSEISLKEFNLSDSHLQGYIEVINSGIGIISDIEILKSNPDLNSYLDRVQTNSNRILLPNQSSKLYFNIPSKEISNPIYSSVQGISSGHSTEVIYSETNLDLINTDSSLRVLSTLISVFLYVLVSMPVYLIIKKFVIKKNG